jgi:hypothetical protein
MSVRRWGMVGISAVKQSRKETEEDEGKQRGSYGNAAETLRDAGRASRLSSTSKGRGDDEGSLLIGGHDAGASNESGKAGGE